MRERDMISARRGGDGGNGSSSMRGSTSTAAAGRREMLSNKPMATSEMTVDEPPNDTSGSVTPVYGSELVTTATLTSVCTASMHVSPVANSRANASGVRQAIRNPRQNRMPNSTSTPTHPTNPSSSPMIAKIASVCALGTQ